jgi:hypothetical protein
VRLSGLFLRQGAAVLIGVAAYLGSGERIALAYLLGAAAGLAGTAVFFLRLRGIDREPPERAARRMGANFVSRAALIGLALLVLMPKSLAAVLVFLGGYFLTQAILWARSMTIFKEGSD